VADLEALSSTYEAAMAAVRDDPDNGEKRMVAARAGQALADARVEQRLADIAAGVRAAHTNVRADEVHRDDGTIGYRDTAPEGGK
jgi:hypothetical protein